MRFDRRSMTLRATLALLLVAGLLAGDGRPAHAATVKVAALQHEASPLLFPWRRFGVWALTDTVAQRVLAYARTSGARGLFRLDPDGGPGAAVAREKDPAPGGRLYGRLGSPSLTAAGDMAWTSRLSGGLGAVLRAGPALVAVLGDPAPGGGLLRDPADATLTSAGDVVFRATISGGPPGAGEAVFRCTGGDGRCTAGGTGTLEALLRAGDPVPDRPGREVCTLADVAASAFGVAVVATTRLDCTDGAETPLTGVFRLPFGSTLATVALQGEAAEPFPAPGGTAYLAPRPLVTIAADGTIAFAATTSGVLATTALYVCAPGACPTAPAVAGVTLGEVDDGGNAFLGLSAPAVTGAGDVAFRARLSGGAGGVYVRRAGGDIETIALTGSFVPATSLVIRSFTGNPVVSPGGKVGVVARVRSPVRPRNRTALLVAE
jgi:hypothetical protein